MSNDLPLVVVSAVAVCAIFFAAASVGRERAKQSVECVRAGGEWLEGKECRKP